MDGGFLAEGDFYFGYNDLNYRHFSYDNWTYYTIFEVPPEILNEERITLDFAGLDTIGSVRLNGHYLGSTNNMFVEYSMDIKEHLKADGKQFLEVDLESAVEWSKKAYERQAKTYVVPPKCVDPAYNGECHANHIRKMQSSFAWDWGPAFPGAGIWKPLWIYGWSNLKIENVLISTHPLEELSLDASQNDSISWEVELKIFLSAAICEKNITGNLSVHLDGIDYLTETVHVTPRRHRLEVKRSFTVPQGRVDLWWPNEYGSQPMYNLTVSWQNLDSINSSFSRKEIRVGFRTIELDQSFIDPQNISLGRHFRFRVNNITMFIKGSNWIPSHVLPERMDQSYIKQMLRDAASTHQNCLRVWGGGIYESDTFYETADELGILLWQDFMFACSMYPATAEFLQSVSLEVESQVRRLQHHPSILIWAGNNENEAALRKNWYGTGLNFTLYKKDYIKLYVDKIRKLTTTLDPNRPFVVSSPSNGIESEEEGFVANNPYDNKYGDVHFYDYSDDGWDPKIYPKTRFASEYGFQSWPSFRTLQNVIEPSDWQVNSAMMSHRQHHPFGNLQLLTQLLQHFKLSKILDGSNSSFPRYLYLTQVNQAMAVKTETEFYRRSWGQLDSNGEGYTSGALYWQLNDIWQGASWSSIEFGGRWKMLHYFAATFFRPILLSPWIDGNKVRISVVNDLLQGIRNLTLEVKIFSYLQMKPLKMIQKNISLVHRQSSVEVETLDLYEDLQIDVCQVLFYNPRRVCFLYFELRSDDTTVPANQTAFLFLEAPRYALLKNAIVEVVNISETSEMEFKISLQTNAIALFVWLETDIEGTFSDNGFLMVNEAQELSFESRSPTTVVDLEASLQITTLANTCDVIIENDILNILT